MTQAARADAAPGPAQAPPSASSGRRGRRGYFLPGAIALAALLLIGGAIGAGDLVHPAPSRLRGPEIASQIALGVQVQQNSATAPHVTCPAVEPVRIGYHFDCTLVAGRGAPVTVAVTEFNGRGGLHWSLGAAQPPQVPSPAFTTAPK